MPDRGWYKRGETLRRTVRATWFFGEPVAGANARAGAVLAPTAAGYAYDTPTHRAETPATMLEVAGQ